jgi:hypothetical protein
MGSARTDPAAEASLGVRFMSGVMFQEAAPCRGAVTARCLRSEDGTQRIAFGREFVTIARRIAGLETSVNVPTQSYRGVALQPFGEGGFRIVMRHADPALDVALAEEPDDAEVIADWRKFGSLTGLPLLVEDAAGRVREIADGRAAQPQPRRYGSPLRRRRPRFLAMRTAGVATA